MPITTKDQNLVTKYYSTKSKQDFNKRRKLQKHIYLVESISEKIIDLYSAKSIDRKISTIEIASIKYACLFHDVGKTVEWKLDGDDLHIEKGKQIITSEEFERNFREISIDLFSETEIDQIIAYVVSAIELHQSIELNNEGYLSSFVSAIVYASDKIAHINKSKDFDKRKEAYSKTKKQIDRLFKKIHAKYECDDNWKVLIFCISQVLKNEKPSQKDTWTIFDEKQ